MSALAAPREEDGLLSREAVLSELTQAGAVGRNDLMIDEEVLLPLLSGGLVVEGSDGRLCHIDFATEGLTEPQVELLENFRKAPEGRIYASRMIFDRNDLDELQKRGLLVWHAGYCHYQAYGKVRHHSAVTAEMRSLSRYSKPHDTAEELTAALLEVRRNIADFRTREQELLARVRLVELRKEEEQLSGDPN